MSQTTKVLIDGKVVEMTDAEMRRRGVLGGEEWDRQHADVESLHSYECMLQGMDLDGRVFHQRVGAHNRTSTGGGTIAPVDPGSEITFDELFEQQEYWS